VGCVKKFIEKFVGGTPHALKYLAVAIFAAIVVLGVVYAFVLRNTNDPIVIASQQDNNDVITTDNSNYVLEQYCPQPQEEVRQNLIMIHISGHVANPNVYEFYEGARVIDAVNAAGGLTEYADEDSINLSDFLYDTMRIIIFGISDNAPHATSGSGAPNVGIASTATGSLININTASIEQLITLNNIGESRARNIIAHREERGGFRNIEELMNVTGIGESIFNGLRDSVTVGN